MKKWGCDEKREIMVGGWVGGERKRERGIWNDKKKTIYI